MQHFSNKCSRSKDADDLNDNESEMDNASTAEDQSIYPAEPECSSVGAELIASRLCLCIKQSQLYTINENNGIYIYIILIYDKYYIIKINSF